MIFLKLSDAGDMNLLFYWRNLPDIVKICESQKEVSWEEHYRWFSTVVNDNNNQIYSYIICDKRKHPLGDLRFDKVRDDAVSTYSVSIHIIDESNRKCGVGSKALMLGLVNLIWNRPDVTYVNAIVRSENVASIQFFEKCGFFYWHKYGNKYGSESKLFKFDMKKLI